MKHGEILVNSLVNCEDRIVRVKRKCCCLVSPAGEDLSPVQAEMKGLFKSKPRTPPDIVRQTRDLLVYADRSVSTPDLRESKSQEKVPPIFSSCDSIYRRNPSLRIDLRILICDNCVAASGAKQELTRVEVNSLWKQ